MQHIRGYVSVASVGQHIPGNPQQSPCTLQYPYACRMLRSNRSWSFRTWRTSDALGNCADSRLNPLMGNETLVKEPSKNVDRKILSNFVVERSMDIVNIRDGGDVTWF